MDIDELAVKITGDSTSLQSAMNEALSSMGKLGIGTTTLTGLLGAAGLTAAFKLAYDAADKMVQAYKDDETAQLKYNAALAASAVITAQGKRALDEYVPVFATMSGLSNANTQSIVAMLSAYGRTDEQIKMMMKTALGMSSVLGGDVSDALTKMNMTLSGNIGRLGQQIPALKDLTAEQLRNGEGVRLLDGKYSQFAGTLKDSTDISIKNYKNAWSNLMSTMGQSIAVTIQPLRDAMTSLFREIIKQANDTDSVLTQVAVGFNNFVDIFKQGFLSLFGKGDIIESVKRAMNIDQVRAETIINLNAMQDKYEDLGKIRARIAGEAAAAEKAAAKIATDAWAAAQKAIIDRRKDATQEYLDTLALNDVRVKLGVMTEQEAADAKYAANQKLMDALISLGYTGAIETGQIGDKTLAEAVARNNDLLAVTTAGAGITNKTWADVARVRGAAETKANDAAQEYANLARVRIEQEAAASKQAATDEADRQQSLADKYATLARKQLADNADAATREKTATEALGAQYVNLAQWRVAQEKAAAAGSYQVNQELTRKQIENFRNVSQTFTGIISNAASAFSSLFSAQADAAVKAVEKRLSDLKKSYGSTASELQTMYDALEKMGASEKAASIKGQLDKEKAVEDYTSLSQAQLAELYASAVEMNDAQSAAEIAAAQARVKAEDDAAAEIKQIKYDGELAAWNMKLLSTTASAAQAAMDAYTSLIGIPVVGPVLAPIAAGAAAAIGVIQIAAVTESKPKLDTGGVVRATSDTSVTVGKGTGEIMFGSSAMGDPLMQSFIEAVAAKVGAIPMPILITLDGKKLADAVVTRMNNGQVRVVQR